MAVNLTETEFSRHINTRFRVNVEAPNPIELELVEVKGYENKNKPGEESGLERFSIFFTGPDNILLQQATYPVSHEQMGQFQIFIVPIAREQQGFRYEAVFNYHIQE